MLAISRLVPGKMQENSNFVLNLVQTLYGQGLGYVPTGLARILLTLDVIPQNLPDPVNINFS